jgi:hypothetical protein
MAPSKEAAIERLDEIGNAEGCPVIRVPEFQIHLKLTDDGDLQLEEWGEATLDFVWRTMYPRIYEAEGVVYAEQPQTNPSTLTPDQQARIRRAVQEERERVIGKEGSDPQTVLGKEIKRDLDMPTSLVNKIVDKDTRERLKSFRPKGKRH